MNCRSRETRGLIFSDPAKETKRTAGTNTKLEVTLHEEVELVLTGNLREHGTGLVLEVPVLRVINTKFLLVEEVHTTSRAVRIVNDRNVLTAVVKLDAAPTASELLS